MAAEPLRPPAGVASASVCGLLSVLPGIVLVETATLASRPGAHPFLLFNGLGMHWLPEAVILNSRLVASGAIATGERS